eukprot:1251744-Amphidinium_carterae.1
MGSWCHEVVGLEAAKRSSQRNAQHWQTRANELEMKVASQVCAYPQRSQTLIKTHPLDPWDEVLFTIVGFF